jgi:hypothetical protein
MTRSTVPQLVYANAVHLLTRQHQHRPAVQLWSHHLITNKLGSIVYFLWIHKMTRDLSFSLLL